MKKPTPPKKRKRIPRSKKDWVVLWSVVSEIACVWNRKGADKFRQNPYPLLLIANNLTYTRAKQMQRLINH